MNRDTIERAVGALVGSVVGDALGAPFEFGPANAFGHRFPSRLLLDPSEMVGGGQWEAAEWTDDTQMALLVADSLLDRTGLDEADLYSRFVEWCRSSPKDVGVQTRSVLASGRPWQSAASEHFARVRKGAGNGSLMRALPGALYFAGADRVVSADAARRISALTHGDPAAGEGCVLYHELVRIALEGDNPLDAIDDALALVKAEHRDQWAHYVAAGYDPLREPMSNGAVWPALGAAVWALRTTSTFDDALRAAIDLGNDTDTVACITGGLAGAVYSIGAIPSRWTSYLHGQVIGRSDSGIGLAELQALARNLVKGRRSPSARLPHTSTLSSRSGWMTRFRCTPPATPVWRRRSRGAASPRVRWSSRSPAPTLPSPPTARTARCGCWTRTAPGSMWPSTPSSVTSSPRSTPPSRSVNQSSFTATVAVPAPAWPCEPGCWLETPRCSVEQATAEMRRRWPHTDTWNPAFTAALTRWAEHRTRPVTPSPSRLNLASPKPHVGMADVPPRATTAVADLDRLRAACSTAISILGRVSAEGGVLSQIAAMSDDQLQGAAPNVVVELAARVEEIAELTRQMRAEDASEILLHSDGTQ